LLSIGYARQIVLSHDYVGYFLGRSMFRTPESRQGLAEWSYTHLFKDVLPKLRTIGVSEAQIETMLVENPQRFFGGQR
jgi:phosphotriesterase-related protein